jgi:hypothetical protein
MSRNSSRLGWLLVVAVGVAACDGATESETTEPDAARETPPPAPQASRWTVSPIEATGPDATLGAGRQLRAARMPSGGVALAWRSEAPETTGPCDELGLPDPPDRRVWPVRYAEPDGDGWRIETAAEIVLLGNPVGMGFAFGPDGVPAIATLAGAPEAGSTVCSAHDVGLFTRTGPDAWSRDIAVRNSGDAAAGAPASDFGSVVGYWAGLAFDGAGRALIPYKDVHSGSIMRDDLARADLELAVGGPGAWTAEPVDVGGGAGDFNAVAVDGSGRTILAWYTPFEATGESQRGIWVARRDADGGDWSRARLHAGASAEGIGLAVHPSGELLVAWYDAVDGRPMLGRLPPDATFTDVADGWSIEPVGSSRFDEGYYPSIAVDPEGRVALAWYRCVRAAAGLGDCNPSDDAAVFAWFAEDEQDWLIEEIDAGEEGLCGRYTALAFDASGQAHVAFQCARRVEESFQMEVRVGVRSALR